MAAPTWVTANIVGPTLIGTGATLKETVNLAQYFEGYLRIRAMRTGSGTPSAGIIILVRRILTGTPSGGTGTVPVVHPTPLAMFQDTTTAANATTLSATPTIPGSTVTLTSATGFAGNQYVGIVNSTSTPTVIEFARTSKIASTTLTMDEPLQNTALASGNTITNNAFIPAPTFVEGATASGDIEIIFDNGLETTVSYIVEVWFDYMTKIA